jgi:hypothetical protein
VIDVSAATWAADAVLRIVMRSSAPNGPNDWGTYASMALQASAPATFAITSVNHVDGAGPVDAFRQGVKLRDPKRYRMLGVPDGES